jgi:hypothetical protein
MLAMKARIPPDSVGIHLDLLVGLGELEITMRPNGFGMYRLLLVPHIESPLRMQESARRKAQEAKARGRLVAHPCEDCGVMLVEMHHEDYSKPLEIRWLCRRHHRKADAALHARLRERGER